MKDQIKQTLETLKEPAYQEFSAKLLPGTSNILGVRLPELRKIAKQLVKAKKYDYLTYEQPLSFEEIMIQGMMIGYLKEDLHLILNEIQQFVPKINNWSVCDSFCSGLKITKHYPHEMWNFLQPYFKSTQAYDVRFAVVMLLNYYLEDEYIHDVLKQLDDVNHPDYYVQMAGAWAISICFVKQELITLEYLKCNKLDDFTYHKALQKIVESKKVSLEMKVKVKQMKRK